MDLGGDAAAQLIREDRDIALTCCCSTPASGWRRKTATDPHCDAARVLATDPAHRVAALDLTLYEIANALGRRRQRPAEAVDLCRLVVGRCGRNARRSRRAADRHEPARSRSEHGLTAYDAAYVAAARRHGWTLVSADVADLVSKGLAVTPDAAV